MSGKTREGPSPVAHVVAICQRLVPVATSFALSIAIGIIASDWSYARATRPSVDDALAEARWMIAIGVGAVGLMAFAAAVGFALAAWQRRRAAIGLLDERIRRTVEVVWSVSIVRGPVLEHGVLVAHGSGISIAQVMDDRAVLRERVERESIRAIEVLSAGSVIGWAFQGEHVLIMAADKRGLRVGTWDADALAAALRSYASLRADPSA